MSIEITPNWLTALRIALIPSGVWAIFHSPSTTWQIIAWLVLDVFGVLKTSAALKCEMAW